jgi:hypothetical protein
MAQGIVDSITIVPNPASQSLIGYLYPAPTVSAQGVSQTNIPFTTTAPGPFTLNHNLGVLPTSVIFEYTNGGAVWFQEARFSTTSLFLIASDEGVEGTAIVFTGDTGP